MGLRAKYDPKEDRMLLTVEGGEGSKPESLWITRRQWVGLLHQMAVLELVPEGDDEEPAQPPKKPPTPLGPQPDARQVERIGLRKKDDEDGSAKLVIGFGEQKGLGIDLPPQRLKGLKRMLEQQAERAGWDTRAGMERLDAGMAARAVMRKAKGG